MKNYLIAAVIASCVSESALASQCRLYMDRFDRFSIGQTVLGGSINGIKNIRRSKSCLELPKDKYVDCEYFDSSGIAYLVEGKSVVRIEARRGEVKGTPHLPWKLTIGENLKRVLIKLSSSPEGFPNWIIVPNADGSAILDTDTCLENSVGERFNIYLKLDKKLNIEMLGMRMTVESE